MTIFDPTGASVKSTSGLIDSTDPHIFRVLLSEQNTNNGTYTVSWHVVSSDDGHFTKGAFSFSIGTASQQSQQTGSQIQIQHITTVPQATTIALELIGQSILIGILFLLICILRPLRKKFGKTAGELINKKRLTLLAFAGIAFTLIGVASFLIIKTFDLQMLQGGNFLTTLHTLLVTVDGRYALYRGILALLFGILLVYSQKHILASRKMTPHEWALLLVFILIMLDRARVSHAAASHFLPNFSILINAVHIFFKEMWVGSVIAFTALLLPLFRNNRISEGTLASVLLSKMLSIIFAAVTLTGTYIIWLHLKDPAYIFTTEWGGAFVVLTLFAGIFAAIRFYHQLIVDKNLEDIPTAIDRTTRKFFGVTILLEALVGIALLLSTSAILITTPPYPPEHFTFEKSATSQEAKITISLSKSTPLQDFLVTVTDENSKKEAIVDNTVITLTNSEKSIGPIIVPLTKISAGGVIFPRALLSPAGTWNIHITAQRSGHYDAIGAFTISYPAEIAASRVDANSRSFGTFETVLVVLCIATLVFAVFLYRHSKKQALTYLVDAKDQSVSVFVRPVFSSLIALACFFCIIAAIPFTYNRFFTTDFQKLCKKNGHFWLQSVPVYDNVALSSNTTTGCFLDVGMYHFSDKKSYTDFFKPVDVAAELLMPDHIIAFHPTDFRIALHTITDGQTTPTDEIGTYHDRILHVIIVDEKFETFAHIHPENFGPITHDMKKTATFSLRYIFPKAGKYIINVGYITRGQEKSNTFTVNVLPGQGIRNSVDVLPNAATDVEEFDGYKVTFKAPKIKTGERVKLEYLIEKDGQGIRNLEPYLGAAMHIAIVKDDLTRFTHTHGEALLPGSVWFQQLFGKYKKYHMHFAPDKFGPTIISSPWTTIFPIPGTYHILGEFKHNGTIHVSHFVVTVS